MRPVEWDLHEWNMSEDRVSEGQVNIGKELCSVMWNQERVKSEWRVSEKDVGLSGDWV